MRCPPQGFDRTHAWRRRIAFPLWQRWRGAIWWGALPQPEGTTGRRTNARQLDPSLLDAVDVFAGLDKPGRDRALNAAHWRKRAAGERAFEQDQEADAFFVLEVGRLKVTQVTPEGQEIIVRYIGPKEMFGCVAVCGGLAYPGTRSEEHTSELQSLMRISYAVFCLKKKKTSQNKPVLHHTTSIPKQSYRSTAPN